MISESWYWKEPLLEAAERLRSFKRARELHGEDLATIERDIFVGFYSIRKLFEAVAKVTDATKHMHLPVSSCPSRRRVTWRNMHRIFDLYDFRQEAKESRSVRSVCNQIIHSFVFAPCFEETGALAGIFTSDTHKDARLFKVDIDDVISAFERVGNDDPTTVEWREDSVGKITSLAY